MTRTYSTTCTDSCSFMSPKTFITLFFSWVCAMKIDFRLSIDPWCGHNPKVLACDGTHIGVSVKHLKLDKPITTPDLVQSVQPAHKIMDRCVLAYPQKLLGETDVAYQERCSFVRQAKKFLLNVAGCIVEGIHVVVSDEEQEKANALSVVEGRPYLSTVISLLFDRSVDQQLLKCLAALLQELLVQDPSVDAVFPWRYHTHLLQCCDSVQQNKFTSQQARELRLYAAEVADLFCAALKHNLAEVSVGFIKECVLFCQELHHRDMPTPAPEPIEGSYNPATGTCYYFTEHGNQVRELPEYSGLKSQSAAGPRCTKLYPQVSYGGFGYIFLFFCPYHGHCYGFHLIKDAEGRKDPFSAITKYMPNPPEDLYYDFACGLSKYSLTREPDFWKNTRLWHDLFHGVGHVCGSVFNTTRIQGMKAANTEICEQFNSYLQCIKYTGSHMSQEHFMLFTQFFIHLWNQDKTERFQNIAKLAWAGVAV